MKTFEITNNNFQIARAQFAAIIRSHRAAGVLTVYGRLGQFGRVMRASTGVEVRLPYWTQAPPMNIHRAAR